MSGYFFIQTWLSPTYLLSLQIIAPSLLTSLHPPQTVLVHLGLRQYGPGTNQLLLLLKRPSLEHTITLTFITWWQNLRMPNYLSRNGTNTSLVTSKLKFRIWNSTLTISNLNLLHPFQLRWNKKTLKELDELLVRERILWKEKAKAHGWKKEMRTLAFFISQRLFTWSTISFTIFLTVQIIVLLTMITFLFISLRIILTYCHEVSLPGTTTSSWHSTHLARGTGSSASTHRADR